ncbi:MAG: thiosulfate ABC transporter substrate-binding protein CysP [Alcaligenaceae bacterium]|nr:thiosulfate ABC transporter substrate-binding protein CysP [Alcaligenaceae bacterium]
MLKKVALHFALVSVIGSFPAHAAETDRLLNASYDIARELFAEYNPLFEKHWQQEHGQKITVEQSHAGTSRQAQAIMQGLKADVVTFNQVTDIDVLANRGFVNKDWQEQFPNNASPYYSTIAFLVRKGNPKNIQSWEDLVREDVKVVFPNPKTSGNARYSYLGAWLYANEQFQGDDTKTKDFVQKLLANVESFPTGGRGATVAFATNNQGDALLTFESEVINIANGDEFKDQGFEIVVPPVSVLAEFPVAVVEKVTEKQKSTELAKAYLNYLYATPAQELLSRYNYRVHDEKVSSQLPEVRLISPTDVLGDWDTIQKTHFAAGGILDQLLAK